MAAYDPDPKLGATPFRLVAAGVTEDKTVVKASPGRLLSVNASNIAAAAAHIKFYDKASVPAVASDVPVWGFTLGGNTAGAPFAPPLPPEGIVFNVGIAFVIVTGAANTDATEVTAADVVLNGSYK